METVDITVPEQVTAPHERLAGSHIDLLFANAKTNYTTDPSATFTDVSTDDFIRVPVTHGTPMTRDSVPRMADAIKAQAGRGRLHCLDRRNQSVNW